MSNILLLGVGGPVAGGSPPAPAVAYDNSASADVPASSTVTLSGFTVAANSNRCLVVFVWVGVDGGGATPNINSVNWNTSEAMTSIYSFLDGATSARIACYRLVNPTATTASVTVSLDRVCSTTISVVSLYNVDQTTPAGTARTRAITTTSTLAYIGCGGNDGAMALGHYWGTDATSVNGIPEYIAAGAITASTATTSRTPAAPAGQQYGMVEIAVCTSENNATHGVSGSGWNAGAQIHGNDSSYTVSWWWRRYNGSNVDPVISWTGNADCSAQRFLFADLKGSGTPILSLGTPANGNGTTHTSTGGNTTANDSLVIYIDVCNANTAIAQPSGWTERADAGSATGPTRIAIGDKEVTTSGSASGNISVTGGNARWIQFQLELLHSDDGDQVDTTSVNFSGDSAFGQYIAREPITAAGDATFGFSFGSIDYAFLCAVPFNKAT